jgi:uncharacterized membrane protein YecN with MAPEG domain
MSTTALYAPVFGLMFVALSLRTVRLRRQLRIPVGDGDYPLLRRAMRVHANFSEYVPIALLLIYFLETQTHSALSPHILCVALLIGRVSHAWGVSQLKENYRFRVFGMFLTLGVIISASLGLLSSYVRSLGAFS